MSGTGKPHSLTTEDRLLQSTEATLLHECFVGASSKGMAPKTFCADGTPGKPDAVWKASEITEGALGS